MSSFIERMLGAAKLDVKTYEEVEADTSALGQAVGVVLIASLAAGIGTLTRAGLSGLVYGLIAALIGWFIWAFITYLVGTKLFPEPQTKSDMGELLRTIGFSSSPGIIRILGIIPALEALVFLVAGIWMLVAMVIAVRQALDYTSTWRAVGVCAIGWIVQVIVIGLMFAVFAGPQGAGQ
ncbi:MAG: YIP1 family protein [Desulfobacterales bacterium]|nr:YIP1 family protein [Desulfobacterales bacterium]